ncbi:peptide-methionine (R)-S-oxide reductase MsrB [Jannaschia donghaensis]|uniref:peptide-methionine (R)-S-oxide reductase n=1 Tax=Jannaschia donghaensis TaxID=420998 RepID=A0A0M6YHR2_9RHOB|nr:peptide-methionine (R)-S-oxide reductase MsrB [Jannaschia donghaensis]CTQ49892.1 Peptide methionine sulfoxide reductase MsrB [Jannaschia donghaensis]
MPNRRTILLGGAAILGAGGLAAYGVLGNDTKAQGEFPLMLSEEEWRARLSEEEFAVLREGATERPFSSPLNDETRAGTFVCGGCTQPLYASDTKFKSGTGWPSFWQAIDPANVGTKPDRSLMITRTEVHCSNCGGHLGHIFDDGPEPTGKRHCINGAALDFQIA